MKKTIAGLLFLIMLGIGIIVQTICYFFPDTSFEAIIFNYRFINTLPNSTEVSDFLYQYCPFILVYMTICLIVCVHLLTTKGLYVLNGIIFLLIVFVLYSKFHIGDYIVRRYQTSELYETEYYPFKSERVVWKRQNNVIVLFVESLENSYGNKDVVPENFLPRLTTIAEEEISVKDHYQVAGTGWSIAGFTALNCGLPLIMPIKGHIYGIDNPFLPKAVCLSDIFAEQGYKQYFVIGSSSVFSGFKNFFKTHGRNQTEIIDEDIFDKKDKGGWGIKDSILFSKLKDVIVEAKNNNVPFFITSMTINTHFPPYLEESCEEKRDDFKAVLKCTDNQVSSFIRWFQENDISKNTVLLIVGDHLAMKNSLYKQYLIPNHSKRRIFNLMITPDNRKLRHERQITTFDWFPSILEAAGINLPQHRLGLGVSLFDENQKTMVEKYGVQPLNQELEKVNKLYDSFL